MNSPEWPRVGDLVHLKPVKTVIQLEDLNRDPEGLASSFVITDEVSFGLKVFLGRLNRNEGVGTFVRGHYGTGKSHFLAFLSLLLRGHEDARRRVMRVEGMETLVNALPRVGVRSVSLVDYQATYSLADIVCGELAGAYQTEPEGHTRKDFFSQVRKRMTEAGEQGLVILLDELSEFLRARPAGPPFHEDLRFLQFLGEAAGDFPLWVIASLQEDIEETGHIATAVFLKIKDRYPVRVAFNMPHVRELVASRLVQKKAGGREAVLRVWQELREAFPSADLDQEAFQSLYPLHPATIAYFEDLKWVLSQKRGVIDFIYYQLRGDPERKIEPFLDQPANRLLTPERIFDHFKDRLTELPEASPYVDRIWRYFSETGQGLLAEATDREVALRAIKLLILKAITPEKRDTTLRELAECLLLPYSDLDPDMNYLYLQGLLDKLWKEGAYLFRKDAEDPLEVSYGVSLKEDVNLKIARRLAGIRKELKDPAVLLFGEAVSLANTGHLPLNNLQGETQWQVQWQNTRREGRVQLASFEDLGDRDLEALGRTFRETETDWFLCMGVPYQVDGQRWHLTEVLLPALRDQGLKSVLFWLPKEVPPDERLLEIAARIVLRQRLRSEPEGQRLEEVLEALLEDDRPLLREWLNRCYGCGEVLSPFQESPVPIESLGLIPFERMLVHLACPVLDQAFPRHRDIAPTSGSLMAAAFDDVVDRLYRQGEVRPEPKRDYSLKLAIEGYVKPLGLVRGGGTYSLVVDPHRNALVRELLGQSRSEGTSREALYWRLRKGPYGIDEASFHLTLLALIFSGLLVPQAGGRRISLSRITYRRAAQIESVHPGRLIDARLAARVAELDWLPAAYQKMDLNLGSQEKLWQAIVTEANEIRGHAEGLTLYLSRYQHFDALQGLPLDLLREDIEKAGAFLDLVKVSKAPLEGLEEFLEGIVQLPFWKGTRERILRFVTFFQEEFDRFCFLRSYVEEAGPLVAAWPEAEGLHELVEEVLGIMKGEGAFFQPDFMERLGRAFHTFQTGYAERYKEEHGSHYDEKRYASLREVRESPLFKRVAVLRDLGLGAGATVLDAVESRVEAALRSRCNRSVEESLRQRPVCGCGFRPGQTLDIPSADRLEEKLEQAMEDARAYLSSEKAREVIETQARTMREIGKTKEAKKLFSFLEEGTREPERLMDVSRTTLSTVSRALASRSTMLDRPLSELVRALEGRIKTREGILSVVQEWLGRGGEGGDVYFNLRETGSSPSKDTPVEEGAYCRVLEEVLFKVLKTGDPAGVSGGMSPAVSGAGPQDQERCEGVLALLNLIRNQAAVERILASSQGRLTGHAWEILYAEHLAEIPLHLEMAGAYLNDRDPVWLRELRSGAGTLQEKARARFKDEYFSLLKAKVEGAEEFWGIWEVLGSLSRDLEEALGEGSLVPGALVPILVDGLRYDLWRQLKGHLKPGRVIQEGVLWSLEPTVTARQVKAILQRDPGPLKQELLFQMAPEELDTLGLEHIGLVDQALHGSTSCLKTLTDQLVPALERVLAKQMAGLRPGGRVLIFGDHGFTENPRYDRTDPHREPRYTHGGVSPEEVLVPWAVIG